MTRSAALVTTMAVVAALGASVACGAKSANTLGPDEGNGGTQDSGNASSSDDATSSSGAGAQGGSSGGGQFVSSNDGGEMGTGSCQTGNYAGTFSCTFIADSNASADSGVIPDSGGGGLFSNFMIMGNLSFVVTQSSAGELGEDTALGNFVLNAGITQGSATLGGMLDCSTGKFTGSLTKGTYSLLGFTGSFDGPLSSNYNGTTFAFVDGTWILTVPGEGYCPGTWTAHYVGDQ